jgi:hypothetical protein
VPLPISVVIPTLDAGHWIAACLQSVKAQDPGEIIVVDGGSTDDTVSRVERAGVRLIRHRGAGPAAARKVGAAVAAGPWIAFVDADIVLPDDALAGLLAEAERRGLAAIQAQFVSEGGSDYWSRQVARHHNRAPSRRWPGLSATLVERAVLERMPLDERLASGEDVDFRRRARAAGIAIGVSDDTTVRHRYASGFDAVSRQWLDDGAGLGRLVRKEGPGFVPYAFIPIAAAGAGILASPRDLLRSVPYYVGHAIGNAVGLIEGLLDSRIALAPRGRLAVAATFVVLWLLGVAAIVVPVAAVTYAVTHVGVLGRWLVAAPWVGILAGAAAVAIVALELRRASGRPAATQDWVRPVYFLLVAGVLAVAALRLAALLGLLP